MPSISYEMLMNLIFFFHYLVHGFFALCCHFKSFSLFGGGVLLTFMAALNLVILDNWTRKEVIPGNLLFTNM
jgi:hypothetical protein